MTGRQRLFALVMIVSIIAILLGFWTRNSVEGFIIASAVCFILWATRTIWLPQNYGATSIRRYSLYVILGVATISLSVPWWQEYLNIIVWRILNETFPNIPLRTSLLLANPSASIYIFVLLGVFIVNYFMRDKTAMRVHQTPAHKEFPEGTYRKDFESILKPLKEHIQQINQDTNWSTDDYTPLDAEVEIRLEKKSIRKVSNLLSALKANSQAETFLILGDPGSGKSVSLRKLCHDLLNESLKTGKIPVYIDLRDWKPEKPWTEENPPQYDDLYNFVLDNLKKRGDIFVQKFFDKYFDRMLKYGRLFLVLDSFDEIPSVLDEHESSQLIDQLSIILFNFIGGANKSRGILASRMFRRPTSKFNADVVLEVRPFSEEKIFESFKRISSVDENIVKQLLFVERPEWVPMARNPFTAALISNYIQNNSNQLPEKQIDLYQNFIIRRLKTPDCVGRMRKNGLSEEVVSTCAVAIARIMFEKADFGLEAPVNKLEVLLPEYSVSEVVKILTLPSVRLGRLGGASNQLFSFVHRRFNEYFVAQHFMLNHDAIPEESIPTDSRWRDALVIYCEVADFDSAKSLAEFCWDEINSNMESVVSLGDLNYLRGLHALRFLSEAFRSRQECLINFRHKLAKFIIRQTESKSNLLVVKLAVEAAGLLQDSDWNQTIINSLEIKNAWVSSTALRASRLLRELDGDLEDQLRRFIDSSTNESFLKQYNGLRFSFSLSESFENLHNYCRIKKISILLTAFVYLLWLFFIPPLVLLLYYFVLINYIFLQLDSPHTFFKKFFRTTSSFSMMVSWLPHGVLGLLILIVSSFFVLYETYISSSGIQIAESNIFCYGLIGFSTCFSYLAFVSFFLLIPWHTVAYYYKKSKHKREFKHRSNNKKSADSISTSVAILGGASIGLVLLGGVLWIINYAFSRISSTGQTWIIGILSFVGALFVLSLFISSAWYRFSDNQRLKSIKIGLKLERKDLVDHFDSFRTPKGRLNYIYMIQDKRVDVIGEWPSLHPPNHFDEASTLLAQLEEKWRGLNR